MTWTFRRVHQTRFYLLACGDQRCPAVCDDFGDLIAVQLEPQCTC